MKTSSIEYNASTQKGIRFDASFHLSDGLITKRLIDSSPYPLKTIGDVSSRIFFGNRAKRVYVTKKENGIPFLSSSDILRSDLENVKLASKKYMPVSDMMLEEGWTLISRSGTIGNCAFANAKHAQKPPLRMLFGWSRITSSEEAWYMHTSPQSTATHCLPKVYLVL